MKTKYLISFIIISFVIIGSVILVDKIFAIQYPVKELGNCQDEAACRSYCDKPENMKVCVDFAEKNNLISKEEIELARKFMAAGSKGPGDCRGKDECEAYCNDIAHMDECITFAVENNLMPPKELEEAKKVQAAIKRGVKPPPCGNKKACDTYCDNPDHMEECITFGEAAGFIQGKELEDAKKMLVAVKKGVKPPPCRGKEACDEYCSSPDNMEMCMNFAMEAGFMNEQEKAESQKMLAALKKGIKPPACKGKKECDVYCSQDEHFEECFQFAEAAGFMSAEEAAMARKTGGKGPGGCKGKEECEAFCNNPDNQEVCFNFGKEHGLIPEEDLKMMEEGKQRFQETMTQMPPEVADCLKSLVGEEMFEKFKSGAVMPPKEIGDQMRTCFEKIGPPAGMMPSGEGQPGPGAGRMMMPEGQAGPGGCKTPDECKTYCESHLEECKNFQPITPPAGPEGVPGKPGEVMPPEGQGKPGGCTTPEECQAYCQSHPEECQGIQPPAMPVPSEGGPKMCPPEGCPQGPPATGLPEGQQPPMENIAPPPSETPPPPSGAITPNSLFGFLLNIFLPVSGR